MNIHLCKRSIPSHIRKKYISVISTNPCDEENSYWSKAYTTEFRPGNDKFMDSYILVDLTEEDILYLTLNGDYLHKLYFTELSTELGTQLKRLL